MLHFCIYFLGYTEILFGDSGAMRFSCAAPAAHFLFLWEMSYAKQEIKTTFDYIPSDDTYGCRLFWNHIQKQSS